MRSNINLSLSIFCAMFFSSFRPVRHPLGARTGKYRSYVSLGFRRRLENQIISVV